MDLELIILQNNILEAINFNKSLLLELRNKKSTRVDLIESLTTGIEKLTKSYLKFKEIDSDLRSAAKRNFDLELICMRQEAELKELREKNKNLIDGL